MQLSKRLKMVTDHLTRDKRVADIGCDHAYISIYLIQHQIARHVVAMDINVGPLERAKANIKKYGYEHKIETRLSNGANELEPGEVDALLIAGMGGALVTKILSQSQEVVDLCDELVLQPQSELFLVRNYLHEHGFQIVDETMLIDEGKYYTIIKAQKGIEKYENPMFYIYGKKLFEKKDAILKQFLEYEYKKKQKVLNQLKSQVKEERISQRIAEIEREMKYIIEGRSYYEQ